MSVCCMCGQKVERLYGDYGVCLKCVPSSQRLTAAVSPVPAEKEASRAAAPLCHTSPDTKADTQTPHNAVRRDGAALGEAPKREVIYGGGFELGWLAEGETVSSAGDGTSAAIVTRANGEEVRLEIGDVFALAAAVPEAGTRFKHSTTCAIHATGHAGCTCGAVPVPATAETNE